MVVSAALLGIWRNSTNYNETVFVKNRLRELRELNGFTQAALAQCLEVSRQTIIALEAEKYDPSLALALKIAKLFGKSVEYIFATDR